MDYKEVALRVLSDLGYEDLDAYRFITLVSEQSGDIALGVDKEGPDDQGIMYGMQVMKANC